MATIVTKTVGPTGDYANLNAFMVGEARDLVAADEIAVARCQTFTDNVAVACTVAQGWVTDSARYIKIEGLADPLGIADYTPSTYFLSGSVNGGPMFHIDAGLVVKVGYIQCRNQGVGVSTTMFGFSGLAVGGQVELYNIVSIPTGHFIKAAAGYTNPIYIWNTYASGGLATLDAISTNILRAQNCVFVSRNAGVNTINTPANTVFKNCYFRSNGGQCLPAGKYSVATTCGTSDATSPTAGLRNIAWNNTNFVNAVGYLDAHIKSGNPMENGGTDTSGDAAPFSFILDVNGNGYATAGAWDVGYHELNGIPPVPPVSYPSPKDSSLIFRRIFDPTNSKLHVLLFAGVSQGSLLSVRQILDDCWDSTGQLRVTDVGGAPSGTSRKLSFEQILRICHDPGAQALRIVKGVAAGGSSRLISRQQILQACFDSVNSAITVSPVGAGGAPGGSLLSIDQILRACYDPGVGLRMDI